MLEDEVMKLMRVDINFIPCVSDPLTAEKRLATAILGRSIRDVLGGRTNSAGIRVLPQNTFDAMDWIMSPEKTPGSYEWICRVLVIDPAWLRTWLKDIFPNLDEARKNEVRRELSFIFWQE